MGPRAAQMHGKLAPAAAAAVAGAVALEENSDPAAVAEAARLAAEAGNSTEIGEAEPAADPAGAREAAVMVGGPGVGEVPAFSYKYGDQEFTTPEALNTYLADLHKRVEDKRVAVVTTAPAAIPVVATTPAVLVDPMDEALKEFEENIFADPRKAAKILADATRKAVSTSLTQQYQTDKAMTTFWTEFYKENKHLVGREDFVEKYVAGKYQAELDPLQLVDARKLLGQKVAEELVTLGVAAPKAAVPRRTVVESATSSGSPRKSDDPAPGAAKPQGEVVTLTQSLKARQAARRSAAVA